jgi:hypothetical protein
MAEARARTRHFGSDRFSAQRARDYICQKYAGKDICQKTHSGTAAARTVVVRRATTGFAEALTMTGVPMRKAAIFSFVCAALRGGALDMKPAVPQNLEYDTCKSRLSDPPRGATHAKLATAPSRNPPPQKTSRMNRRAPKEKEKRKPPKRIEICPNE